MAPIPADPHSLLHIERISQYVSLSPASLSTPLPALCASIFSPLLLSYFPPARGVVLAYEDVSLSATPPRSKTTSNGAENATNEPLLLTHVDEYSAPFLWATANFLVWRPRRNAMIQGRITQQSQTHISLSHLNTFPVSVLKDHLPSTWTWQATAANAQSKAWDGRMSDEGGCWVDEQGEQVQNGTEVEVRIRDFDGRMDGKGRGKGFLKIEGSLVSIEEEEDVRRRGNKGKGKAHGVLKRSAEALIVE